MNTDKATNVYERMLIEFYNEFLTEYAPENELKHIEKDINQEILASEIKDDVTLYEYIQEYFEVCDCTDGTEPLPGLISYETVNTRGKHQEYYNFIIGVLDEELDEIYKWMDDSLVACETLYTTGDESIDNLLMEVVYRKMKWQIENHINLLEFKIEADGVEYVLLISGRFLL